MTEEQKTRILNLLDANHLGVLATNSDSGFPASAVVTISHTDDLSILFGSFDTTRKNTNIKKNSSVSIVVGWDMIERKTMQIEGQAVLVTGEERERVENIHCAKNENFNSRRDNLHQEYFKIVPHWIRYSDLSVKPTEVWEVTL